MKIRHTDVILMVSPAAEKALLLNPVWYTLTTKGQDKEKCAVLSQLELLHGFGVG